MEKRSWLAENRPKSSTPEVLYGLLVTFFEIDLDSSIGCHVPFREAKCHEKSLPRLQKARNNNNKNIKQQKHGNFKSISYILEVKIYESPLCSIIFSHLDMYFLVILTRKTSLQESWLRIDHKDFLPAKVVKKPAGSWTSPAAWKMQVGKNYMDVSKNSGTPKSSILIGISIINHPFWDTPIFGNTHITPIINGLWNNPK